MGSVPSILPRIRQCHERGFCFGERVKGMRYVLDTGKLMYIHTSYPCSTSVCTWWFFIYPVNSHPPPKLPRRFRPSPLLAGCFSIHHPCAHPPCLATSIIRCRHLDKHKHRRRHQQERSSFPDTELPLGLAHLQNQGPSTHACHGTHGLPVLLSSLFLKAPHIRIVESRCRAGTNLHPCQPTLRPSRTRRSPLPIAPFVVVGVHIHFMVGIGMRIALPPIARADTT